MTAVCLKTTVGGYTFTLGGYITGSVFDKTTDGGHTIGIGGYTITVGGYTISSVFDKTTDGEHTSTLGGFQNESIVRNYNPCFFIYDKQNLSTKLKHDTVCRIKNLYLFNEKVKKTNTINKNRKTR